MNTDIRDDIEVFDRKIAQIAEDVLLNENRMKDEVYWAKVEKMLRYVNGKLSDLITHVAIVRQTVKKDGK